MLHDLLHTIKKGGVQCTSELLGPPGLLSLRGGDWARVEHHM